MLHFLGTLILLLVILGLAQSLMLRQSSDQRAFERGKVPTGLGGAYRGTARIPTFGWKGKKFIMATQTGINLFEKNGAVREVYPFRTWTGKGLTDHDTDVLKIDYNLPTNPFWLRWVLDELVEVAPGKYLGKAMVKIIPGLPFTVVFFRLER